jgi:hypothetical protein
MSGFSDMGKHESILPFHPWFSTLPKAAGKPWALQVAEKLPSSAFCESFVSGHDFSRADKANRMNGALAPAGCVLRIQSEIPSFSAASLAPVGLRPISAGTFLKHATASSVADSARIAYRSGAI